MKYTCPDSSSEAVFQHPRNKNIAVFPVHRTWGHRVFGRLSDYLSRGVRKALKADFEMVVSEQIVEKLKTLCLAAAPGRRL